jgi:hypothetical protein
MEGRGMVRRTRTWVWFTAVVLLVTGPAACSDDDGSDGDAGAGGTDAEAAGGDPVVGSFVGDVSGTEAFVAVVAEPPRDGEDPAVQVYLSDGEGLSEWFSGPVSDNTFVAESDDGDAEIEGELSADSVTGTVELPDGATEEYTATPPSGPEGLYDLTVSDAGDLSGVSAAGLAVTGEIPPIPPGEPETGVLRLVDGTSLEFAVTREPTGDLAHLRDGQVRLILLPDGELRGAGSWPSEGEGSLILLRSAPTPE